jgi:hypothetical protein
MALRILATEWAKSAEAEDNDQDNDQPCAVVKAEKGLTGPPMFNTSYNNVTRIRASSFYS